MKKTFRILGIIAIVAVIGSMLVIIISCGGGGSGPTIIGGGGNSDCITLGHDWNATQETVSEGVQAKTCKRVGCTEKTAFAFSYKIGNTGPGGGIIFFVADGVGNLAGADGALGTGTAKTTPGFTFFQNASDSVGVTRYYLEVATTTIASQQWASANHLIPGLSQNSTDDTDWAIGRGMKNTEIIIAHGVATVPSYITQVATSARTGTDWFLPSKNELNELASRRNHANINITSGSFWSSSQYDSSTAWSQYFGSGGQDGGGKVGNDDVHAIRAF